MRISSAIWTRGPATRPLCLVAAAAFSLFGCQGSPISPDDGKPPTDPLAVVCPMSPVVSSADAMTAVPYGQATVTGGAAPVSVACVPASGSSFPIGMTPVTCTATDAQQRTAACSLSVTVSRSPRLQKTSYVAFGDSITAGEDGTIAGSRLGPLVFLVGREYPTVLQQLLAAAYPAQASSIRVANRGMPREAAGDASALSRFSDVLGQGFEVVLIMEGSNDLGSRDALVLTQTIANLRSMLNQARNRNVVPYLATIPPMIRDRYNSLGATLVPIINSRIRQLAADEGVTLVDVAAAFGGDGPFDSSPLVNTDGLHPTEEGFRVIASAFFEKLQATLELTAARAPFSTRRTSKPRSFPF